MQSHVLYRNLSKISLPYDFFGLSCPFAETLSHLTSLKCVLCPLSNYVTQLRNFSLALSIQYQYNINTISIQQEMQWRKKMLVKNRPICVGSILLGNKGLRELGRDIRKCQLRCCGRVAKCRQNVQLHGLLRQWG